MARRPRGRPSTLLSLKRCHGSSSSPTSAPNQAIVALVDLNGRFLAREAVPLVSEPARSVTKIVQLHGIHARPLTAIAAFEGIGISMPAAFDPDTQRLLLAPISSGATTTSRRHRAVRCSFRSSSPNAANACLLSELWSGRLERASATPSSSPFSEGIGGAILANGQIIPAAAASPASSATAPSTPPAPSAAAASAAAGRSSPPPPPPCATTPTRPKETNTPRVTKHSRPAPPDPRRRSHAIAAVTQQATHLGRGLRLVTASLSPEVVLITGDLTTSWARFGPIIQKEMAGSMLAGAPPDLGITKDGELSRLRAQPPSSCSGTPAITHPLTWPASGREAAARQPSAK